MPLKRSIIRCLSLLFAPLTLLFLADPVFSAVGYVTDVFQIPLRTGPSTEHRISAMPGSGQTVEILDSQGDWSRVRVVGENEKEGWVLSRYLITRQPWEMQTKVLKEENNTLRQKLISSENKLSDILRQRDDLTKRTESEGKAFQGLQKDYDSLRKGAEDYLKVKSLYEQAEQKLRQVSSQLDEIGAENRQLRASEKTRWLATGALVLLCGLIIGITIGKREKRRRSLLA
jgi:SH3 domain protein